jgi:hypothetical protein
LRRREELGISGPAPLPHPDDLIINARTENVTIREPLIESEKDLWLLADILKTDYRDIIATNENILIRDTNHPQRAVLLKRIADAKRAEATLSEHYADEVIDRVVQSRTTPSGDVEFIDPESIMWTWRKPPFSSEANLA